MLGTDLLNVDKRNTSERGRTGKRSERSGEQSSGLRTSLSTDMIPRKNRGAHPTTTLVDIQRGEEDSSGFSLPTADINFRLRSARRERERKRSVKERRKKECRHTDREWNLFWLSFIFMTPLFILLLLPRREMMKIRRRKEKRSRRPKWTSSFPRRKSWSSTRN